MIISKEAVITISRKTKQRYCNLGYTCNIGDKISVKIEDLQKFSKATIVISCDYCGKHFTSLYSTYNANKKKTIIDKDCCSECQPLKTKEVFMLKYGVSHNSHIPDVINKKKNTMLEKYGVENPSQSDMIKEKKRQTYLEHYGVDNYMKTQEYLEKTKKTNMQKYGMENALQSPIVIAKRKQTCLEKYGVEVAASSEIVKQKVKQTNLKRYGCECVFSNDDIKEKIQESLLKHGNIRTSKVQHQLYKQLLDFGYNVELNYRVGKYFLDVALFYCGKQIDIEYDGQYWHQNTQKDQERNDYVLNHGWQVLRIRGNCMLPDMNYLTTVFDRMVKENIQLDLLYLKDWKF